MANPTCLIGNGIEINGDVTGAGDLCIEGRLEGRVILKSDVVVEDGGTLLAEIEARNIHIRGKMSGNASATELIAITKTAVVTGEIKAPKISIEDGARFAGSIEMDVPLPPDL